MDGILTNGEFSRFSPLPGLFSMSENKTQGLYMGVHPLSQWDAT
jgi:hypothetical protein